jgi:hypothetical protein
MGRDAAEFPKVYSHFGATCLHIQVRRWQHQNVGTPVPDYRMTHQRGQYSSHRSKEPNVINNFTHNIDSSTI